MDHIFSLHYSSTAPLTIEIINHTETLNSVMLGEYKLDKNVASWLFCPLICCWQEIPCFILPQSFSQIC